VEQQGGITQTEAVALLPATIEPGYGTRGAAGALPPALPADDPFWPQTPITFGRRSGKYGAPSMPKTSRAQSLATPAQATPGVHTSLASPTLSALKKPIEKKSDNNKRRAQEDDFAPKREMAIRSLLRASRELKALSAKRTASPTLSTPHPLKKERQHERNDDDFAPKREEAIRSLSRTSRELKALSAKRAARDTP
jgi:hypothetical protein